MAKAAFASSTFAATTWRSSVMINFPMLFQPPLWEKRPQKSARKQLQKKETEHPRLAAAAASTEDIFPKRGAIK